MQYLNVSDRADNLIICGDVHGEFGRLVETLEGNGVQDAVVIVAGDCGLGFREERYYEGMYRLLHRWLERMNVLVLLVRGNHDDPQYFQKELVDYPFMKALPDYTVVHTGRHNVLCVGGAVSVDRQWRKRKMAEEGRVVYWEDEGMVYDEKELEILEMERGGIEVEIDTVVTHTAPEFCPPTAKRELETWCREDATLAEDVQRERENAGRLFRWLEEHEHPLERWYYGHFHEPGTHWEGDCCFEMLDVLELCTVDE